MKTLQKIKGYERFKELTGNQRFLLQLKDNSEFGETFYTLKIDDKYIDNIKEDYYYYEDTEPTKFDGTQVIVKKKMIFFEVTYNLYTINKAIKATINQAEYINAFNDTTSDELEKLSIEELKKIGELKKFN